MLPSSPLVVVTVGVILCWKSPCSHALRLHRYPSIVIDSLACGRTLLRSGVSWACKCSSEEQALIAQVVPTYSEGPLHAERVTIRARISKDLQDQAFIDSGFLLLALLSFVKSVWLQDLRPVKTIQDLGHFWVWLKSY